MPPCQEDNRSFFEKLQKAEGLDLRDNRGKRHELAVVLVGVTIALLSNRDGCLSSIERHLRNHYEKLVLVLKVTKGRPVSRSQLPLILEKVAVEVFNGMLFENYGIKLNKAEREWFALDGKEMRGSISKGEKRDERWERCQIKTVVKIRRERVELKSGKRSLEESYYVTNEVGRYEELCEAVRRHWTVETNNHIRDVSLKEDQMRSKKRSYSERWGA